MDIEISQVNDEEYLTTQNVQVLLNGEAQPHITSAKVELDADSVIPRVILTIIPSQLKVSVDGKTIMKYEKMLIIMIK